MWIVWDKKHTQPRAKQSKRACSGHSLHAPTCEVYEWRKRDGEGREPLRVRKKIKVWDKKSDEYQGKITNG